MGGPPRPPDQQEPTKVPWAQHEPKKNQRNPGKPTIQPKKQLSYAAAAAASAAASSYEQLADNSRTKRNGIIAKLNPIPGSQRAALSQADWAELLFDHAELDPKEMTGIDFFSGSKGTVEILMKENVNMEKYMKTNVEFKGYKLQLSETQTDETKVVLFNVPLLVPDEEIFNLIESYGGVMKDKKVHRELVGGKNGFTTKKGKKIEILGTTRYLYATFPANKFLRRYYWMEGPCRNDPGRRITIQHRGQKERACGHCLEWASACPTLANTNLCRENFPHKRKPLAQYMKEVAEQDGYESLKTKYCGYLDFEEQEAQARDINDHQIFDLEDVIGDGEILEGDGFQNNVVADADKGKLPTALNPTAGAEEKKEAPKPNNTNKDPENQQKEGGEDLAKMLAEKEKELKLLKEENNKALSEFARLKTENNSLKRNQANDRKNNSKYIREHLQNSLGWNTSKEHTSNMATNIIDQSQFVFDKVNDKILVKEGADPWSAFKKTIDLTNTDKATEDRFKDLQKMVLGKLKDKFSDKKTRSESKTRNRSDSSQEDTQQAKKAKEVDFMKEEEQAKEEEKEKEKKNDSNQEEEKQAKAKEDETKKVPDQVKEKKDEKEMEKKANNAQTKENEDDGEGEEDEEANGKKKGGEQKKEGGPPKKLDSKVKNKPSPGGRNKKNKNNGF